MAFTETLKRKIRRMADLRCCICHSIGVEIHHIVPQEEKGPDTVANAAPLCPSCHETYGGNPLKRKFIREARDIWFEKVRDNGAHSKALLSAILERLDQIVPSNSQSGKESKPFLSLGEILAYLYDFGNIPNINAISKKDSEFVYMFFFGGVISPLFDEIKDKFVSMFGVESAKRICGYFASLREFRPDGFIEDEIEEIGKDIQIFMTILSLHEEVCPDGDGIKVRLNTEGELVFFKS